MTRNAPRTKATPNAPILEEVPPVEEPSEDVQKALALEQQKMNNAVLQAQVTYLGNRCAELTAEIVELKR